ncbi:signal peptidase I [Actinosynnema pretiosum subsp. pretiosum]|uniref:Signal peptidase I n=1 Tax=Actinosynnema pretiosum subsp. pretiosum TaxID=103721 RepID=A0AA45L9K3_9PSEU|nr:Basic proline-rich protein precursor [Actinosynnema pretiosum subsp. pretiosum]QUF06164.1 signal peptidase I [Actinosynnema pretiosum subsp. pretiosum]
MTTSAAGKPTSDQGDTATAPSATAPAPRTAPVPRTAETPFGTAPAPRTAETPGADVDTTAERAVPTARTGTAPTAPTGTAPTDTAPTGTAPTGTAPTGTAPVATAPTASDETAADTALATAAPTATAPTATEPTATAPATGSGRRRHKALRVLGGVLLFLIATAAVAAAVAVVILKIGFAPVLTPSMKPVYNPGDLLITRATPVSEIKIGDVVVLPRPDMEGERYAHRVISLNTSEGRTVVRTKGDNNTDPDPQALRIESATVPVGIGDLPGVGRAALAVGQAGWLRVAVIVLVGLALLLALKRALIQPAPPGRHAKGRR